MKKIITLALFALVSLSTFADTGTATGDTLTVYGKQFPILEDSDGEYIQCHKNNGKPYRMKIWPETGDTFEKQAVRRYKKSSYFVYGISKHGFPMYIWLDKYN